MTNASWNSASRPFWQAFVLNFVWMNISETFRYFVVVKPMVRADFAMVPGIVPATLSIAVLWVVWDMLLISVTTFTSWLVIARFGTRVRVAAAAGTLIWTSVFVLLWLGLHNMGLARAHTVLAALPLAWIEVVIASFLVRWRLICSLLDAT